MVADKFVDEDDLTVDRRGEIIRFCEQEVLWIVFDRTMEGCIRAGGSSLVFGDSLVGRSIRAVFMKM